MIDRKYFRLTNHFIERFNTLTGQELIGISQEALVVLMLHDWPGNVRELENTLEHAFVMCRGELIQVDHLPQRILPEDKEFQVVPHVTLKEIEKQAIIQTLERNQWKKSEEG